MRREGFTLLEILLAICITAVIASVLLKVITAATPDVGKAKFLKAYSTTKTVIAEIIADTSLYPDSRYTDEKDAQGNRKKNPNYGFANTTKPTYGFYAMAHPSRYQGDCKLPNIFADRLGMSPKDGGCTSSWYDYPRGAVSYKFAKDGTGYKITIASLAGNSDKVIFGYAEVGNDGYVTCKEVSKTKNYCKNMYELRQGQDAQSK